MRPSETDLRADRDSWRRTAERLQRENFALMDALKAIALHARLDERDRGFGEASRYYGIADHAIGTCGVPVVPPTEPPTCEGGNT